MKSRVNIPLAIVSLSILGFFLIIVQLSDRGRLKLTAREMHNRVLSENYILDQEKYNKLEAPVLIDIRDRSSFTVSGGPEGSVNIPVSTLLDEENLQQFKGQNPKVILAHDPISANETWMLLTQMGYESIFVLDPTDLE